MISGLKAILAAAVGLLVVANGHASTASAQNASGNGVFRIGNFDRSSVEFAPGNPKQPVNFVVGQSDPAKDWYATQLAELNAGSGTKASDVSTAARTITFSI